MTKLTDILRARIHAEGPMTVSTFMQEVLLHPEHGYYVNANPFGADGDFVTAPEISQMFGELIGLALAQCWLDQNRPTPFNLVELGPGRGTLMADALRATRKVPGFLDAASLHLVEASTRLREKQSEAISLPVTFHDGLTSVPDGPLFLIANEFFDALPIRQFVRDKDHWREKLIGLENENLAFGLSDPTSPTFLAARLEDTKDGDIVEVCRTATTLAADIGARIAQLGGVALIFDYGDWRSLGDTLQAVKDHAPTSLLEAPGEADLTAHVDFEAIAQAAAPATTTRLTPQGVFLERLGIAARAETLAKGLSDEALDSHIAAHRRLTHPDEMGTLFKALAIIKAGDPLPPGFAP